MLNPKEKSASALFFAMSAVLVSAGVLLSLIVWFAVPDLSSVIPWTNLVLILFIFFGVVAFLVGLVLRYSGGAKEDAPAQQ